VCSQVFENRNGGQYGVKRAVLDGEAGAAAARLRRLRIVNAEGSANQIVDKIDLGASQKP
jgi:hypothetical protein